MILRRPVMRDYMNDTIPIDARASEIQKCKDLPILSKLDCPCRNPVEVKLVL